MAAELLSDPSASFPQRGDTMYMNTVRPEDMGRTVVRAIKTTNRVDDIDGAHPARKYRDLQKPVQTYHDLPGVKPRALIPSEVNKPNDRGVNNRDIDRSWPVEQTFHSKRCIDPLNPQYQLPKVEERPLTPPPPGRDHINTHDIEGSKPRSRFRSPVRDHINYADVEGSSPNWRSRARGETAPRDTISCKDINGDGIFRTTRVVNPLEPLYKYDVPRDESGAPVDAEWTIGHVPGAKPVFKHRELKGSVDKMNTRDVPGAYAGWAPESREERERREFRNINFVGDIDGAQADTRYRFKSERRTDPVDPRYVLLDATTHSRPHTPVHLREDQQSAQRLTTPASALQETAAAAVTGGEADVSAVPEAPEQAKKLTTSPQVPLLPSLATGKPEPLAPAARRTSGASGGGAAAGGRAPLAATTGSAALAASRRSSGVSATRASPLATAIPQASTTPQPLGASQQRRASIGSLTSKVSQKSHRSLKEEQQLQEDIASVRSLKL
eukprot:TRINITY_DN7175_c0_g1_i1.p1 TRINITY_DN7175_c0_g1~~TRINITY_DN7175_c0_g1_i1.p1  ORF type:complete len:498 (-),score=96.61 TRINITY_DN7175_c0_g1_i1:86-1579(-)